MDLNLFFATENGKIISLDAKSGEKIWESKIKGFYQVPQLMA